MEHSRLSAADVASLLRAYLGLRHSMHGRLYTECMASSTQMLGKAGRWARLRVGCRCINGTQLFHEVEEEGDAGVACGNYKHLSSGPCDAFCCCKHITPTEAASERSLPASTSCSGRCLYQGTLTSAPPLASSVLPPSAPASATSPSRAGPSSRSSGSSGLPFAGATASVAACAPPSPPRSCCATCKQSAACPLLLAHLARGSLHASLTCCPQMLNVRMEALAVGQQHADLSAAC